AVEQDYEAQIKTKEAEMEKVNKSKDQLLDLLMDELISKQDFKRRNDLLTADIERIEREVVGIEADIKLRCKNKNELANLKKVLEEEFSKTRPELNKILLDKILVHKLGGDKSHVRLEIRLNLGNSYLAEVNGNNIISLEQIGISQAQVSRLEKNALKNMKKYIS
ncbi:MAG: hypothetical protein FWE33_02255, partial [Defluviitaleaceae bacterium]|nr:hypothetical protein [Defluviitaleaceae bacterium]